MRSPVSVALIAALAVVSSSSVTAQAPIDTSKQPLKSAMQWKLEHSKSILEGLALEDYEKIAKHSQALNLLSLEAGWKVIQTEEYVAHSREFRRTAKNITQAAREKNLERAALGYVALTVRCVECHGYLRRSHPELPTTQAAADSRDAKASPGGNVTD